MSLHDEERPQRHREGGHVKARDTEKCQEPQELGEAGKGPSFPSAFSGNMELTTP